MPVYVDQNSIVNEVIDHTFLNADVDECAEDTSGCSQQCNNTIGSFECSCTDGYRLGFDRKTCHGMYVLHCMGVSLSTSNLCAQPT